jgi:GR25 family glycosyltransferase involved in LPS biosynthesis
MNAHVYCINLKNRPDRWKRFSSQPAFTEIQKEFQFERIDAVNGKDINIQNDKRISVRTRRNILLQNRRDHEDIDTPGAVGCYLSHVLVWKKFLQTSEDYCIVFEDDAAIPNTFVPRFKNALRSIKELPVKRPILWQLSKPHGAYLRNAFQVQLDIRDNWIYDAPSPTTGYVLFRETAQILLDTAFPIDGHVDMYMRRCAQIGMLDIISYKYLIIPTVGVKQKDTDIQLNKCELCNIPTNLSKTNLKLVTKEQILSTTIIIIGLSALAVVQHFKK